MVTADFEAQLRGYCLTTANILYKIPDHPAVLQSYIWQEYDLAPSYPALHKFLDFWHRQLDGPLHSVTVAQRRLIRPGDVRMVTDELLLH
jgi:uncharacterized protein Usg